MTLKGHAVFNMFLERLSVHHDINIIRAGHGQDILGISEQQIQQELKRC